ncbi:hypothetical protein [Shinella sp. M31]|uniref:hypothetical protein n=1 Tax=Shinella sp. M31 TaxID=3368615 RepID=UPI003BA09F5B
MLNVATITTPERQPLVALNDNERPDPREAYLEWLAMEARLLRIELYGEAWRERELTPSGTAAKTFHFPHDRSWKDVPPPSTRAELVLAIVGALPRLTQ